MLPLFPCRYARIAAASPLFTTATSSSRRFTSGETAMFARARRTGRPTAGSRDGRYGNEDGFEKHIAFRLGSRRPELRRSAST